MGRSIDEKIDFLIRKFDEDQIVRFGKICDDNLNLFVESTCDNELIKYNNLKSIIKSKFVCDLSF